MLLEHCIAIIAVRHGEQQNTERSGATDHLAVRGRPHIYHLLYDLLLPTDHSLRHHLQSGFLLEEKSAQKKLKGTKVVRHL